MFVLPPLHPSAQKKSSNSWPSLLPSSCYRCRLFAPRSLQLVIFLLLIRCRYRCPLSLHMWMFFLPGGCTHCQPRCRLLQGEPWLLFVRCCCHCALSSSISLFFRQSGQSSAAIRQIGPSDLLIDPSRFPGGQNREDPRPARLPLGCGRRGVPGGAALFVLPCLSL